MIDQHDRLKDLVMNLIQHDVWLHTRSYMLKVAIDFDCVFSGSLSSMSLINRLWEICACFLWSRLYLSLHFSQNGSIRLKTLAAHFYEGVNCNKHYLSAFNGSFNLSCEEKDSQPASTQDLMQREGNKATYLLVGIIFCIHMPRLQLV